MSLRSLRANEADRAATMLAHAFHGRPFPSLLADDPAARFNASRWMFAGLARYGLAFGTVSVVGDLDGVAIWWGPEYVDATDERLAEVGLGDAPVVLGRQAWHRVLAYDAVAAEIHRRSIDEPHWYLCVIGVAPDAQGRGLASALLTAMFDRLDRERLPAYLDTNTPENVAYYLRRGFVVAAEQVDPTSGILIRGMRRDPR
jgi:ribosomal protein S18 acetylase RimI-like enzyme